MGWIVFEALLALAVALLAVWWTFRSRRDAEDAESPDSPDGPA
jgi:membrane protein implicated in regulation of membrane protease activity